jgi:hypothetical protein
LKHRQTERASLETKSRILACPRSVTKAFSRLNVAMHDPLRTRRVQRIGNLDA